MNAPQIAGEPARFGFQALTPLDIEGLAEPCQRTTARRLYERDGVRYRLFIGSDASNPTRADLERWNGEQWHQVASLPRHHRATAKVCNYLPRPSPSLFQAFQLDELALLFDASLVLDGSAPE